MKKLLFAMVLAFAFNYATIAKNTTTRIAQVTEAVTLSEDVDYVITGDIPFAVTGSIDITNTEHAVVIFENIRPSDALAYLSFIKINGEEAVNDETCQVKMYAHGSIIMPYGKDIKPLTVYSEQNFGGESVNNFGLEHSGGYMNTLTTAKLNNRIRSFKLKRGYMVTFSNSPNGRGYSRCFIANDADLEFATLPEVMDEKISSYRIFKWYDTEKKGLANNTSYEATQALNVSWCYSFGLGENRGIDCECVPHQIYTTWPSTSSCGSVTYSPHLKTSNEPGNSGDPNPESVETILNSWENLMATGMRICSPSSHDGSLSHLWEFMDSIEARGWRCDILDIHSYWDTGSFYQLSGWYNKYKRPIWITEWVWGASWNNNGAFSSGRQNDDATYNGTVPILALINDWDYVERYAYWNSEQWYTQIYRDNALTRLGEYYAEMKSGMGYKKAYEYVPKVVCVHPRNLTLNYDKKTRVLDLSWISKNRELTDSMFLELRIGNGDWEVLEKYVSPEDDNFTYTNTLGADFQSGLYTYRIHNYDMDGQERYSNEATITLSGTSGTESFQYGRMEIADTGDQIGYYQMESGVPYVFVGLSTYNNTKTGLVNNLKSVLSGNFTFRYFPWQHGSNTSEMTKAETTDFMVMANNLEKVGNLTFKVGDAGRIGKDSTRVNFSTPFPEGVTPVVFAYVQTTSTVYPYTIKVWAIDNEGFAVKLERQAMEDEVQLGSLTAQKVYYAAVTPGQTLMENGKLLTVGTSSELVDGRSARLVTFTDEEGTQLGFLNPYVLFGVQTNNYNCTSVYRVNITTGAYTEEATVNDETVTLYKGFKIIRQKDDTNTEAPTDYYKTNGDLMGWMVVSDPLDGGNSIRDIADTRAAISVDDGRISVEGCDAYSIYTLNGMQVDSNSRLPKGVYVVKVGKQVTKVLIP